MCHDSFVCAMTHSYQVSEANICVIYDMTHSEVSELIHVCHDLFVCAMTHLYVLRLICMCHDSLVCVMTHSYQVSGANIRINSHHHF